MQVARQRLATKRLTAPKIRPAPPIATIAFPPLTIRVVRKVAMVARPRRGAC